MHQMLERLDTMRRHDMEDGAPADVGCPVIMPGKTRLGASIARRDNTLVADRRLRIGQPKEGKLYAAWQPIQ